MSNNDLPTSSHSQPASCACRHGAALSWIGRGLCAIGIATALPAAAIDFGPFSLNGFAKYEITRGTNICHDCQREANENRHRIWADDIVYSKKFGTSTSHVSLVQPYLGFNKRLDGGFNVFALYSQRWRDGEVDIPGAVYERNFGISHEDYGRLAIGAMTSRAWSVADYPYATFYSLNDAWPSSGAGYALLGHAVRYTSRKLDVFEGDLVLEVTYDKGRSGWKRNKPQFVELYAQYVKGDLIIDAMVQDSHNGEPVAWGHAPFNSPTNDRADDAKLGSTSQGIFMLMARYLYSPRFEYTGGIRFNRWSGSYAVQTVPGPRGLWNSMWNVNWGGTLNGVPNPGYPARSTDFMLGMRHRAGPWIASAGLTYLGKASTDNPSERGQSNDMLVTTVGLNYDFGNGLQLYGMAGMVHYGRKGLAPLSMPSHNAFTNVDSRVATRGNWIGLGAVYTF